MVTRYYQYLIPVGGSTAYAPPLMAEISVGPRQPASTYVYIIYGYTYVPRDILGISIVPMLGWRHVRKLGGLTGVQIAEHDAVCRSSQARL